MTSWLNKQQGHVHEFVANLKVCCKAKRGSTVLLRRFCSCWNKHAGSERTIENAVRELLLEVTKDGITKTRIDRARIIYKYLEWQAYKGLISTNPLRVLRDKCTRRSTAAVLRALAQHDVDVALNRLQQYPAFGSAFGTLFRNYIRHKRELGYRYVSAERNLIRFDRFLQQNQTSTSNELSEAIRKWQNEGKSPYARYCRLQVARLALRCIRRANPTQYVNFHDQRLRKRTALQFRKPHIFTVGEIQLLLRTALASRTIRSPLRYLTQYTMLLLAYCAGLRIGELVRLKIRDYRRDDKSIDIRESKFFKTRCLPLSTGIARALDTYLSAREAAGVPLHPGAALFFHGDGRAYSVITVGAFLRQIIKRAGLKPEGGFKGPRVHDLRHTFVVHRILTWYKQGLDPTPRLPFLWTYLGHRDLLSTLTYITITRELLHQGNERYRTFNMDLLAKVG